MNPAMAPASTVDAQVCAWLAAVLRDGAGAEPPVAAGAAVATAQPQPQPPEQVLAVASRHGVASLVHERLRLHPDGSPLQAAFADAARRQAMRSLWLQAEARRLLAALHAAGLRVLVLKGAALAGWLYPAAHLRDCGDLDLLLASHADAQRAAAVLAQCGYPDGYQQGGHAYELLRKPAPGAAYRLELDLHWRLLNAPVFAEALDFEALWAGSIAIPALGPQVRGLGAVHALLHAAMNRVVNLYTDVGDLLKCLYDIHLLAARQDVEMWAQALSLARARGLCGVLLSGLDAAQAALGTAVPVSVRTALVAAAPAERLEMARLHDWSYMQWRSAAALPPGARLRWLWGRLLPDAEFLRSTYGADASLPRLWWRHGRRLLARLSATRAASSPPDEGA